MLAFAGRASGFRDFSHRWTLLLVLLCGAALDSAMGQSPPVRSRAVLYEEDVTDPSGRMYVGTVVWRTERVATAPGQKPDIVVHADIDIPQKIAARWSIQRSDVPSVSHHINVQFITPDLSHGSVASVPGILVKNEETARGSALAGAAVKVTDNFFLIGLTAVDIDRTRNIELIQQRSWVDIPLVYGDGVRALIAFEKGRDGTRAIADAFAAWEGGR
jgi:hypothetical protein